MILLSSNSGFSWFSHNNIYCKGCFFDNENRYYEKENLIHFFENLTSFDQFITALKKCNGIFSVVIKKQNSYWLAVDRNISFPLFYSTFNNELFISDDPINILSKEKNILWDEDQLPIYKAFGHTFNYKTLFKNINTVPCAEAVQLSLSGCEQHEYHTFCVEKFQNFSFSELKEKGILVFEEMAQRLIRSLNGRTAVIPLSGGYDSRFIAASLKKMGYSNVICYTYGKKEKNQEWILSKKVADKLGFKWFFIEHKNDLIRKYLNLNEIEPYILFLSHGSSFFFLQEYFAVRYLTENHLIPEDSVFLPGHSGDLLGGSQWVKVFEKNLSLKQIPSHFINTKAIYHPLAKIPRQKLAKELNGLLQKHQHTIPPTLFEEIDIKEKISKVIFNSSLVFDFFGYEKRFPFWDLALLNFFLSVPAEFREVKKLYDEILIDEYFKPLDIHFKIELQPGYNTLKKLQIKNYIKKYFPKKVLNKKLIERDWLNYNFAVQLFINDLEENNYPVNHHYLNFNEVLISYNLFVLEKKVKELQYQQSLIVD